VDEEAPEPEPEPEEPGVWREYLEALRERLVAQLWSAALLTMAIAPLAVAGVLMYRTGRRWFLVSGLLWFVVLAVLRPDRWQRD